MAVVAAAVVCVLLSVSESVVSLAVGVVLVFEKVVESVLETDVSCL